jgi:hypothetical protein
MGIDWEELRTNIEAEVKCKTRNRFSFYEDLVSLTVSEVLYHAVGKHSSGKIVTRKRLEKYSRNHVSNAIRKTKRIHCREVNLRHFNDLVEDGLPVYDDGLPLEISTLEGIPQISDLDRKIVRNLLAGYSQANLLREKIVSSRRKLRKAIQRIKPFFI